MARIKEILENSAHLRSLTNLPNPRKDTKIGGALER
jgi:hypothetical protein